MPRPFSKHAVPRGCIAESKATAVTLAMGNGAAVASGTPLQASLSVPVSSPQPHYKLQHRAAGPPSSVSVSARTRSNSYVRAARPAALSTGHTRRRSAFRDGTARAAATLVRPHARGEKLAGPFSTPIRSSLLRFRSVVSASNALVGVCGAVRVCRSVRPRDRDWTG